MSAVKETDFAELDDSALISRRQAMRDALAKLPPYSDAHQRLAAWYDMSTIEIDHRAREAWTKEHQ
jgi:hypothetical protein